ncbi:MAG: hypothetical protein ACK5LT_13235 [Lachnospirales bacterium]
MRQFKKIFAMLIVVTMILSTSTVMFVQSENSTEILEEYTVEDVKNIEVYAAVENGYFVFDRDSAVLDGVSADLIDGQIAYFDKLNVKVDEGYIRINSDLSIGQLLATPDIHGIALV